jgi:hypothetical protein
VRGNQTQAQALLDQLAGRVQALGLKLKSEKTAITHIDEGFVFLEQRIVRRPKGTSATSTPSSQTRLWPSVGRKVKALDYSTGAAMCTSRTPPRSG